MICYAIIEVILAVFLIIVNGSSVKVALVVFVFAADPNLSFQFFAIIIGGRYDFLDVILFLLESL